MKYLLSFINTKINAEYPDMQFESLTAIEEHVQKHYPTFTSYGIVVLKCEAPVQP